MLRPSTFLSCILLSLLLLYGTASSAQDTQTQPIITPTADPVLLQQQLIALAEENRLIKHELAQLRKIDQHNQQLEIKLVTLEREVQLLQQENQALRDTQQQTWFLYGAGVLVSGLLLGLIIPLLRRRKSSRWNDL